VSRVVVAKSISVGGDWLLLTAASIEVYRHTNSTAAVSALLAGAALPAILLGPFAGATADRRDRRLIMLACDVASAIALLVALAGADTRLALATVYCAAVAIGIVSTFDRPASEALLPSLCPPEGLGRANSMLRLGTRVAMIAGPAAGSWLLDSGGFRLVLLADAATFLASASLIAGLRRPGSVVEGRVPEGAWRAAVAGLSYAGRSHPIRTVIFAIGVTLLVGQIVNAGTIAFISKELDEPANRYGLLLAVEGAGAIVLAVAFTALGPRLQLLPTGCASLVTTGAATFALGFAPNLAISLAAMAMMGAGVVGLQVAFASYLQREAPDAYRGRVMSLAAMTASVAGLLGLASTAPLVYLLGVRLAFDLAGVVIVLAAIPVLALTFRSAAVTAPASEAKA
jgi:MFS family permease